ncbi:MAG: hypothetical protein JKY93_12400 [Gammaproteobacteria bacterium]|nr:hypothetical protein [Gammaproteobacteria bacterium]
MTSVSKALICNLALAHINQTETQISNLDTDLGNVAIQCRIHYDVARRFVLADHNWNFACKRVVLADIGSPPTNYAFRYDYPSDCLKFREIERLSRLSLPIPYAVEDDGSESGLSIITDKDEATGVYTYDVQNVSLFSPSFVAGLAWYLASELAPALTGALDKQESTLTIYRNYMNSAQSTDSDEGVSDKELDSPWERARLGGEDLD